MKKIGSVILCMLVLITTVLSVASQAADDDFIGMRFDLGENLPAGYSNLDLSIYEDALRTTAVGPDSHVVFNCSFNSGEYNYIAIKYRVSHDISQPWFYMKDTSMPAIAAKDGTFTNVNWTLDGEWHKAIYCISESFTALANKDINQFRLSGGDVAGDTVDFLYICFFKTKEAAEAFDGFPEETAAPETTEAETAKETENTTSAINTENTANPVETERTPDTAKEPTETEKNTEDTKSADGNVSAEKIKKVKTIVIILSVVILLCAVALFAVYMFKEGANKTFAAIIAVVLLICSIAIIIVFVLL